MRNPLKRYYYIRFDRMDDGNKVGEHFRMCSSWAWRKPKDVYQDILEMICEDQGCSESELFLAAFNTN